MRFEAFTNSAGLDESAAARVAEEVAAKPNLLMCTATGSSPMGLYRRLDHWQRQQPGLFGEIRIIKLDEWLGMPDSSAGTCEQYLKKWLVKPLRITPDRFISFSSDPPVPVEEAGRIQSYLIRHGPIDLSILGLGRNGHLGLNEPGPALQPDCHVATLSPESRQHEMVTHLGMVPERGLTLGMRHLLNSRHIILIVAGSGKQKALKTLESGRITTLCPASFLWLHPRVDCLILKD